MSISRNAPPERPLTPFIRHGDHYFSHGPNKLAINVVPCFLLLYYFQLFSSYIIRGHIALSLSLIRFFAALTSIRNIVDVYSLVNIQAAGVDGIK